MDNRDVEKSATSETAVTEMARLQKIGATRRQLKEHYSNLVNHVGNNLILRFARWMRRAFISSVGLCWMRFIR